MMVWYRSLSVQQKDVFSYDGFGSVSPLLVCMVFLLLLLLPVEDLHWRKENNPNSAE
jgi:hypothetical protein